MININSKVKTPHGVGVVSALVANREVLPIGAKISATVEYPDSIRVNGERWLNHTYDLSELVIDSSV